MLRRFLAGQFARPHGIAGRLLLGGLLDRIGEPMMEAAFKALEARRGDRVLDLGFGGGALVARLLDAGALVEGIDRSEAMVARAQRRHRVAVEEGRARFQPGSALALPLRDRSVHRAASVNTLYFWPDLMLPLRELARVLMPGGRLVLGYQVADAVRDWPGHVHGFVAHADGSVDEALSGAGFRLQDEYWGEDRRVGRWRTLAAVCAFAPIR